MSSPQETKERNIDLSNITGPVCVKVGDLEINIDADGNTTIASADIAQRLLPRKACKIGEKLPDGWVVMGISPDTGTVFSAEPSSSALQRHQTWHAGEEHAKQLEKEGHKNARQPSLRELRTIFEDVVRAGRNTNAQLLVGSRKRSTYWSNASHWEGMDFSALRNIDAEGAGQESWVKQSEAQAYVRCIRDEPSLKISM